MIRIFLTGDNHIGLKYTKYEKSGELVQARLDALKRAVTAANEEKCHILAVAGDLFAALDPLGTMDVSQRNVVIPRAESLRIDALLPADGHGLVLPREIRLPADGKMRHQNTWQTVGLFRDEIRQSGKIFTHAILARRIFDGRIIALVAERNGGDNTLLRDLDHIGPEDGPAVAVFGRDTEDVHVMPPP